MYYYSLIYNKTLTFITPGEESLEEFGLRGSKVVIEALLVVGKTRWEEREDERAKEIFVVGLRVEEGLFVTELLVPEVQAKIFLTKVVLVLLKHLQNK